MTHYWFLFVLTAAALHENCFFNEQCEATMNYTECRDRKCVCRSNAKAIDMEDGTIKCIHPPTNLVGKLSKLRPNYYFFKLNNK